MKFELINENAAGIYVDSASQDFKGLLHVAKILIQDVKMVTDRDLSMDESVTDKPQIIVGTLEKSPLIEQMVEQGILDVSSLGGKRESYVIRLITYHNAAKLVIVGTETVATLHGIYHISRKLGISPWVYWADVKPAVKKEIIFDQTIEFESKQPSVKYRGFFMNDEWPSLGNFVMNTFGDFNEFFYEKVFDLLLRLKGNYFWPAMWSASLPLDGSEDPLAIIKLATELGITIGQSHHEPLMRASEEWDKVKTDENNVGYGKDWNYYTNSEGLYRYWEDGAKRDKDFKHMITIGMRGERDTMMLGEDSTIQENVELLRQIITDQKKIIRDTGCDHMPKMLALYKEVEDFYYGGNGVKGLQGWDELEDVTLLLSDDNFGHLRTLPTEDVRERKAGWGLYYHFDYHGGPISYEWVNSTPLPKVWEQVSMAYDYGIRDLWIANVGDIRPDELPLSYFMELAYDFEGLGTGHKNETDTFIKKWVAEQFGAFVKDDTCLDEIFHVLKEYTRIHGLRRPEAMNPEVYHVAHFNETQRMIERCEVLMERTNALRVRIPEEAQDTFYGLVYYPAVAGMNLQLMSLYAAQNKWYAKQGLAAANLCHEKVKAAIQRDEELTAYYNEGMADGKWKGMMYSNHACFVSWNEEGWHFPETSQITVPQKGQLFVHAEGADEFVSTGSTALPEFTAIGGENYRIELANSGQSPLEYEIEAPAGVRVSSSNGIVAEDVVAVNVCVTDCEAGEFEKDIVVKTTEQSVLVKVKHSARVENIPTGTYVERDGIVSMEAEGYVESEAYDGHHFVQLSEYGRTSSVMKIYPTIGNFDKIGMAPSLTYSVYVKETGDYTLKVITTPANNLENGRTVRYAVSANGETPIVGDTILAENYNIGGGSWKTEKGWAQGVLNNAHYGITTHHLKEGLNQIRYYGVEAGLGLQKLMLYRGNLPESYLGAEESPRA